MQLITIMPVFGTRPEVIKMAPVVNELQKYPDKIRTIVTLSAQHREMMDQMLDIFEISFVRSSSNDRSGFKSRPQATFDAARSWATWSCSSREILCRSISCALISCCVRARICSSACLRSVISVEIPQTP